MNGGGKSASYFLRNRRAFDLAVRCQGSKMAVQSGTRFDRDTTDPERVAAAIFSSTIREYSAGEHFPRAIICPRRPIVSQEANANSNIIMGNKIVFRRRCFLIAGRWEPTLGAARSAASTRCTATRVRRTTRTLYRFHFLHGRAQRGVSNSQILHRECSCGSIMRKLLAIGVVTVSLANFGTCLAQTCSAAPFTATAASTILHHT